jgi:hypothetical protein
VIDNAAGLDVPYEMLQEIPRHIFFLFKRKCSVGMTEHYLVVFAFSAP